MLYRLVLVLKLAAVMAYGGGLAAAFLASSLEERKRAVHSVASPALLAIWASGYALASMIDVPLTELWILGALVFSCFSQGALVVGVAKNERGVGTFVAASLPIAVVLAFMVFRPTWALLRSR